MKSAIHTSLIIACLSLLFTTGISQQGNCKMGSLPTVMFPPGSSKLTNTAMSLLKISADELKNNPQCNLEVKGYAAGTKKSQQLSWDHVNTIINYLNENHGISRNRMIFKYGEAGSPEASVDLSATTEDGPNNVPPPHPQLRRQ